MIASLAVIALATALPLAIGGVLYLGQERAPARVKVDGLNAPR